MIVLPDVFTEGIGGFFASFFRWGANKYSNEPIKKEEDGYDFILNIPFADKADMDMGQKGSELMIQIKNEKRCFTLPDILRNKTVQNARYEEGQLHIKFA